MSHKHIVCVTKFGGVAALPMIRRIFLSPITPPHPPAPGGINKVKHENLIDIVVAIQFQALFEHVFLYVLIGAFKSYFGHCLKLLALVEGSIQRKKIYGNKQ